MTNQILGETQLHYNKTRVLQINIVKLKKGFLV